MSRRWCIKTLPGEFSSLIFFAQTGVFHKNENKDSIDISAIRATDLAAQYYGKG